MADLYLNDPDWQEPCVITRVTEHTTAEGVYYDLLMREFDETGDGHTGFGLKAADVLAAGLEPPQVGDVIALCHSLGRPIRGVSLNTRLVYYRTPAEEKERCAQEVIRHRAERFAEYEAKRTAMQTRVDALPAEFRARIERFRRNNPDFGPEFEGYELSCCEDAQHVLATYQTCEEINAFAKMDWPEQKAAVPKISEGHSGNSFGFLVRLAWLYRKDPTLVAKEHGALCPLVGCDAYGCWSEAELSEMRAQNV